MSINKEKKGLVLCVIIAKRCKVRQKNQWVLAKIRDRNYNPEYELDVITEKSIETLFMTDQASGWNEGVNSTGLMIVSAALDNHSDQDVGETKIKSTDEQIQKKNKKANETLKEAMRQSSVKKAIRILKRELLVGTTFVSDGKELIILEIYIKEEANDRELLRLKDQITKLSPAELIMAKKFTKNDFVTAIKQIKKDDLVVRTNHGKLLTKAGYQPDDEDKSGWNSSVYREMITRKALSEPMHPVDVITTLRSLKGIEKIKQNNPVREKEPEKDGEQPYYTGSIILLTPAGVMFAIPVEDSIKSDEKMRLKKDRIVDFILLPKNLNLFENLSYFHGMMYTV